MNKNIVRVLLYNAHCVFSARVYQCFLRSVVLGITLTRRSLTIIFAYIRVTAYYILMTVTPVCYYVL